jgi:hypothetical protein
VVVLSLGPYQFDYSRIQLPPINPQAAQRIGQSHQTSNGGSSRKGSPSLDPALMESPKGSLANGGSLLTDKSKTGPASPLRSDSGLGDHEHDHDGDEPSDATGPGESGRPMTGLPISSARDARDDDDDEDTRSGSTSAGGGIGGGGRPSSDSGLIAGGDREQDSNRNSKPDSDGGKATEDEPSVFARKKRTAATN